MLLDPGDNPSCDRDTGILHEGLPQEPEEGVIAPLPEAGDSNDRGRNRAEDNGVYGLAGTGGPHQPTDQTALQPLGFEANHDDRVRELSSEESAYPG